MTKSAAQKLTPKQRQDNAWFLVRLVEAGYSKKEAESMLAQDLADAAEEDGYDGP